jgi:hypothetical protein
MVVGVEVKPGKPYTHRYEASHGRLRICQVWVPQFYYFHLLGVLQAAHFVTSILLLNFMELPQYCYLLCVNAEQLSYSLFAGYTWQL